MEKAMQIKNFYIISEIQKVRIHFILANWSMFNCLKNHCILINKLDGTVNEEDLEQYFGKFGKILNIHIHYKVKGLASASIFFEDVEVAKTAAKYKSVRICNKPLEVEYFENLSKAPKEPERIEPTDETRKITVQEIPRTLTVRNVNKFTSNREILNIFSQFGEIDRVLSFGQKTLKSFNIVFENEGGYNKALSSSDLYIGKRLLEVSPTKWNSFWHLQDYFVDVSGLSREATIGDLEENFKSFGTILKCDVDDSEGYVFFEDKESATKALSLSGSNLSNFKGNVITVQQNHKKMTEKMIFVKKVNECITKEALLSELKPIGEVEKIKEGEQKFTITFTNEMGALKAKNMKELTIDGCKVALEVFNKEKLVGKFGIIIENLTMETDIKHVFKHFKRCGEIIKSYVAKSKLKGTTGRYGYLEFANKDGQDKALRLNRSMLNGKVITLRCSK